MTSYSAGLKPKISSNAWMNPFAFGPLIRLGRVHISGFNEGQAGRFPDTLFFGVRAGIVAARNKTF
jgi:hypothetical protein